MGAAYAKLEVESIGNDQPTANSIVAGTPGSNLRNAMPDAQE
jgi:hypothetical protein